MREILCNIKETVTLLTTELTDRVPGHNHGRVFGGMGDMTEMRHEFGGNVVSLVRRMAQRDEQQGARMNFPAIRQVDAYWEGLRDGRLMPERAEVDPRGLESALEFAFMLEHVAPGVARVRVAGMHLNDLLGMETRGMPITAFFEPAARVQFARVLDEVVQTPKVADLTLSSPRGIGRPALEARMYMAPLGTGGTGHARILGCLQSTGEVGRAPRRFTLEQAHMRRILGAATPGADYTPAPQASAPRRNEMAEPKAVFRHAPRRATATGTGKPDLRLIKTDD